MLTLGAMRSVWAAFIALTCFAASPDDQQFNGRWDISAGGTLNANARSQAWWLELNGAGTDNVRGKFVGAPGGQLDDIPKISISDGELRFSFFKKYHRDHKDPEMGLYWARLEGGKLKGTFEIEGEPSSYLEWTGVRAPVLADKDDGAWKRGDPVSLFDGKDLNGWHTLLPNKPSGWSVRNGVLMNSPATSDLASDRKFMNFDLHVEYAIAARSNSGIGLRGRYEVQILDDYGRPPSLHGNGALYSRIAPLVNASKPPGEWQAFDIRLIGRQVSVTVNGLLIIDKATIDGLTAIADEANEADPGPIVLQGDHGPVEFRKIVVYPLVKSR